MEEFLMYAVPIGIFVVSTVIGFFAAKAQSKAWITLITVAWFAFTIAMFIALDSAVGWDGLLYVIALIFVSAPSGLGGLVGAITCWVKKAANTPPALT